VTSYDGNREDSLMMAPVGDLLTSSVHTYCM